MSLIRVAFIGLAIHSGTLDPRDPKPGYLHTFKAMKDVKIVAYCVNPESGWMMPEDRTRLDVLKAVETEARFYTDVDDLIAREEFELAVILLPPTEIPDVGIKLARAGKHIFCEKQFATTAAAMLPLVQAVQANKVTFSAAYNLRWNPVAVQLRQLVNDGMLGELTALELRQVTSQIHSGTGRNPKQWQYRMAFEGGGFLHYLGCHYLELGRALMGCEVKRVSAFTSTPIRHADAGIDEVSMLLLEWQNGAVGTMHMGYLAPPEAPADNYIALRGSLGAAIWNNKANPNLLKVYSSRWTAVPERSFEFNFKRRPLVYGESQANFELCSRAVDAVRANVSPPVTEVDALRVLEVIDAAYESARTGRHVEVNYHKL